MDAVAEEPEGGPNALLVGGGVVTEADLAFDDGLFSWRGGECGFGLDAA